MTIQLRHNSTLIFYDRPLLFVGSDAFGANYLVLVIDDAHDATTLLATPVTIDNLSKIKSGAYDVSQAFREPAAVAYYLAHHHNGDELADVRFEALATRDVATEWLPDEGLFLTQASKPDGLTQISIERNSPILQISLTQGNSFAPNSVEASTLVEVVGVIQRLVKHGCRRARAISYLQYIEERRRNGQDVLAQSKIDPGTFTLNAFAVSPGSFSLMLEPQSGADMFGFGDIARALSYLDELNRIILLPDDSIGFLSNHRGHFAAAYKRFISIIFETSTCISYSWTMPSLPETRSGQFSPNDVMQLYRRLQTGDDLSESEISVTGIFRQVDTDTGTWRLESAEDDTEYRGKLPPGSSLSLAGITVGTQIYSIVCTERVIDDVSSLREKTELLLRSFT